MGSFSWPGATRLGSIDRKLLRFLYARLKSGDDTEDVRQAFDKYWKDWEIESIAA